MASQLPQPSHASLPALLATLTISTAAVAGGTLQETQIADYSFDLTPGGTTVSFASFDDHGGTRTLQNTILTLEAEVGGSVFTENSQLAASDDVSVHLSGVVAASTADLFTAINVNTQFLADAPVAGTNGQPGGPDLFDFGWLGAWDSAADETTDPITDPATDGTVQVNVYGAANFLPDQPYNTWDWTVSEFQASGRVILTYEYTETTPSPSACTGDINHDGTVDFSDLVDVLAAWGACPVVALCPEDVQPSGMVDAGDLFNVLTHWGPCPK